MKQLYWMLPALVIGFAIAGNPARAQNNVTCNGVLPDGIYNSVNVLAHAVCTLNKGVTVLANVSVATGAQLVSQGATINGSVTSRAADFIKLDATTVGINVQFVGGKRASPPFFETFAVILTKSNIGGGVQIVNMLGSAHSNILVEDNIISGNLTLSNNQTDNEPPAGIKVDGNTVGGNLTCLGNFPTPTGSSNKVSGNVTGQCSL